MPSCTVCTHPQHEQIDLAIVAGLSVRHVASQHDGLSYRSVHRHKINHLADFLEAVLERSLERLEAGFYEVIESARNDLNCEHWAGRSAARNDILKIIRLTETKERPAITERNEGVETDLRAKADALLRRLMQERGLMPEQALEFLQERAPTLATYLRGEGDENRRSVKESQAD